MFTGATWNGLNGSFVCWGGPCGVTTVDGDSTLASAMGTVGTTERTGHWYFIPHATPTETQVGGFHPSTSRSRFYVATGDDTYAIDTMFARFGYWLAMDGRRR